MMHLQKVRTCVREALECSVFVSPRGPGLTFSEIHEVCTKMGFQPGETADGMAQENLYAIGRSSQLVGPTDDTKMQWKFYFRDDPELRDFKAFDFVHAEFAALIRSQGAANADIDRSVLVERGSAGGIDRHGLEVAVAILILSEFLTEREGRLRVTHSTAGPPYPSAQLANQKTVQRRETRSLVLPFVKDVVARRFDGRASQAEPLDAFADQLDHLGYGHFRLWWTQTAAEMRRSDDQSSSLSVCVLAAALIEGALTFVVKHAKAIRIGPFGSTTFEKDSRHWRIEDLVASAAAGGPQAILDSAARGRVEGVIRSRQRIHAGRVLAEHPGGLPDMRPDEARDARQTAELVVRQTLDWLEKHPPS